MNNSKIATALSHEALYGKSKVYITRGLNAKSRADHGEYQLWASLALELLGKSALAAIHPSLVADPQSYISLFAAAGINIDTDIKTIIAKTVFERLTHVSAQGKKRFDTNTAKFCQDMALKRNAELHSGEVPFDAMPLSSWEGRYWYTAEIILELNSQTLERWLGANAARASRMVLDEYVNAITEAAKIRIETAGLNFKTLPKAKQKEVLDCAETIQEWEISRIFKHSLDDAWPVRCPVCNSKAFMAGTKIAEEVCREQDYLSDQELVDVTYSGEVFMCPTCGLELKSTAEIEVAGLCTEHAEVVEREREYEPDYGND